MAKLTRFQKLIPILGYLAFMVMQTIMGVLLILGVIKPHDDPLLPLYEPLTFLDLFYLYLMNIPTLVIIGIAWKNARKESK